MYLVVSIFIQMYLDVFICIQFGTVVSVCIQMYSDVFVCIQFGTVVSGCIRMYSDVFGCICMYPVRGTNIRYRTVSMEFYNSSVKIKEETVYHLCHIYDIM